MRVSANFSTTINNLTQKFVSALERISHGDLNEKNLVDLKKSSIHIKAVWKLLKIENDLTETLLRELK
ncbi:MAG: hypothetical protein NZO16_07415 [Deltaproteobacteria bacterium]|nr:hypothetical protein [Deltaproteobacteria bacterium]